MSGVKALVVRSSARERAKLRRAWEGMRSKAPIERGPSQQAPQKVLIGFEEERRRAHRALALFSACAIANVPLDAETRELRGRIEAFIKAPSAEQKSAVETWEKRLGEGQVMKQLESRRVRLFAVLETLREPDWRETLEAFRPGLGEDLAALEQRFPKEGWPAAQKPLAELEALLSARARARVELICQGGEAAGFRATPITRDPVHRAFVAELHDAEGLLSRIAEHELDWTALADEMAIELRGPAEWDGPACVHGGYGELMRALRAQGVEAVLYAEDGTELWPPDDSGQGALERELAYETREEQKTG